MRATTAIVGDNMRQIREWCHSNGVTFAHVLPITERSYDNARGVVGLTEIRYLTDVTTWSTHAQFMLNTNLTIATNPIYG